MLQVTAPTNDSRALTPRAVGPVAKVAGPRFGHPHKATLIRWITKGISTPDGGRVRLRAWRLGSRWMTDIESVEEFARAVLVTSDPASPPRSATVRQRSSDRAAAELRAMGM